MEVYYNEINAEKCAELGLCKGCKFEFGELTVGMCTAVIAKKCAKQGHPGLKIPEFYCQSCCIVVS